MGRHGLVVVTGASSGGKSTLLRALSREGLRVMPEAGRITVRHSRRTGGGAEPWVDPRRFAHRTFWQAAKQRVRAEGQGTPVFFDRSMLDPALFLMSEGYAEAAALRDLYQRVPYDPTVFFAPPWSEIFTNDRERRTDPLAAAEEYERLLLGYRAAGYAPVILPKTTVAERVAFVMRVLSQRGIAQAR